MNEAIRRLFPVTNHYVYLNHAAVSPISLPVYEQMNGYTRDLLERGLVRYREWWEAVEAVRRSAARLIQAAPDEIAFAPNTSTGLALIANGIAWERGDNVVSADCEFPSNLLPWQRLGPAYGVELRLVPERHARLETEEILAAIDDRTRVVTLSFVEFASGFRNDLATIGRYCRERGVLFVVDAIQGLGALQLDVEACQIDALAADAHKFLLGPDGVALLYVRRGVLDRITPTVLGWMSVENPFSFTHTERSLAPGARRFEPGALNTAGIVGLGAAIDLFLETGPERIEQYLLDLAGYLRRGLESRGYEVVSSPRPGERSSFLCCRHPRHSAEALHQLLEAEGVITTPRLGRLRISPHFYNVAAEIDRLLEALPV